MKNVAVLGGGNIGGTVAVYLADNPDLSVTVCVRSPLARLTIDTPAGPKSFAPKVLNAPETAQPVDWVMVATKAYDVPGLAPWFSRLIGPGTRIAILQNGVEHIERLAPYAAPEQLVPVVIDMPVERLGPGHFHQRRKGSLIVPADANGKAFAELFVNEGLQAAPMADFKSEAWRKLAQNCAGAVSSLLKKPASVVQSPPLAAIMREMVEECIAVGRAEGATLGEDLADKIMDNNRKGPQDAINSLTADRIAGRPLEVDARNGAVVRLGLKHGIPTPANRIVVGLMEGDAG